MNRKNVAAILAISLLYVFVDLGMTTLPRHQLSMLHRGIPNGRFDTCVRRAAPLAFHPMNRPERKLISLQNNMFPNFGKCSSFILPTCQHIMIHRNQMSKMFILLKKNPQLLPRLQGTPMSCTFNQMCQFPSIHRSPPCRGMLGIVPPAPGVVIGPHIRPPLQRPGFLPPYPRPPSIPTLPQLNYYPPRKPPSIIGEASERNISQGIFNNPPDVQGPKIEREPPGKGSEIVKEPNFPNEPPGSSSQAESEETPSNNKPPEPENRSKSGSDPGEGITDEGQTNKPNAEPEPNSESENKKEMRFNEQPNLPDEQPWSSSESDPGEGQQSSADGLGFEIEKNITIGNLGIEKKLSIGGESGKGFDLRIEMEPSSANGQNKASLEFEIEKNLTIGNLEIGKILSIDGESGKGLDFGFENEMKFGKK